MARLNRWSNCLIPVFLILSCAGVRTAQASDFLPLKMTGLEWPEELSKTFFLDLRLANGEGEVLSRNSYWLSPIKDVVKGKNRSWQDFAMTMESTPDFTPLEDLPMVEIKTDISLESTEYEKQATVRVKNASNHLAFGVRLSITKEEGG